jgi:aldose 1-epimerase
VIQGHDCIEDVINSPQAYLNTLIGRYGNRIAGGKFNLDGKEYTLAINNGPNNLHGGPTGFHARVWDAEQTDAQTVVLSYLSADGEEGFPGNLQMSVTFTFTDENELILDYKGTTDKKTIVNMTHHGFFSLSGLDNPTPSIENNIVTINANWYTPIDDVCIPTGEIAPVAGTPMDFRTPHPVGSTINEDFEQLKFGNGYDHNYVLNKKEPNELSFAARIVEPISGRTMEVYTTEPGVQVYTNNWGDGFEGAHGATFPARSSICFEAQHFPDSPNKGHFPSVVLNPGETYTQKTIYKFGTEN